jgi:hypothetical protein
LAADFTFINGRHPEIDYEQFEKDVRVLLPCPSAKVYALNEFPALVSADAGVDLLLIIAIEDRKGNYYRIRKHKWVYLNNLIIPVRFVDNYASQTLEEDEDGLLADGDALDFTDEINGLKNGLTDYLSARCGFNRSDLYVHPLIFIKSPDKTAFERHVAMGAAFTFPLLLDYLKYSPDTLLCSYRPWINPAIYALLDNTMEAVIAQAAKDSLTGYLTKQKVERIVAALASEQPLYQELNQCLISIEGKAGTGKTSQLLILMMRLIDSRRNTLFLTYNKLLVYDIAKLVNSYLQKTAKKSKDFIGLHSVGTLHSFFYRLSRKLAVLHLMSDKRIEELTKLLKSRVKVVYPLIKGQPDIDTVRELIQNHSDLDAGIKEVGIELIRFIVRTRGFVGADLKEATIEFVQHKTKMLGGIEASRVFLADYYKVLDNTLLAMTNPQAYFEKFDIKNKFDLLEPEMALKDRHKVLEIDMQVLIDESEFIKTLNRKIGGIRKARTVFIDEAQDCHAYEKDILFTMFGFKNIVLANGGKVQLIRHNELCNWHLSKGRKLRLKPLASKRPAARPEDSGLSGLFGAEELAQMTSTEARPDAGPYEMIRLKNPAKSYRIKKSLLDFCNFVAEECGIELGMSAVSSSDVGELIFDFRYDADTEDLEPEFNAMMRKSSLHGCSAYESLLVLIDAESKTDRSGEASVMPGEAVINEYGNIEDGYFTRKKEWAHKKGLEDAQMMFWDGATDDKNRLAVPSPNECRLLYYESCRGLEAWSVACFNIDRFYDDRVNDPDAEKFLLNEERESGIQQLHISNEARKNMFAGTWALMALTRPMDTLYLNFQDPNAAFTQLARRYLETHPKNVKVIGL